ncbi:hypothetical protein CLNEO_09920 [Anaerotignum neopropionicum]|uniref:Uncharacterized protein n=1 Tax=Anaerotignum neopropionicum TaxID=36847 RepID=A0A136WGS7_9FIRM|nr:hypothetical protein [Anaerotignum neopropionicum]KXL53766.1 hypothetical protein CLNEO_09920 [Anaerotignum neopropionicum]
MNKASRFAKIIRVVTVVPVMALTTLSILYGLRPSIFQGTFQYILSIIFLTVLPISAYPLQLILPKYRNKGREGQRNLALMMGVSGYLFGIVFTLCSHATKELLVIYLIYFLSGIGILIFNKIFKIRASGHACGVAGPISILVYFIGIKALVSVVVLMMVYWASIKTKRHTTSQLLWGTIIPLFALIISKFWLSL